MRLTPSAAALCLATLLLGATTATANTGSANARELFPGEAQTQEIAGESSRWYKHHLVAGRSYALLVWAPTMTPPAGQVVLESVVYLNDGDSIAKVQYDLDIEPRMSAGEHAAIQLKIIPTLTQMHRFRVRNLAPTAATVNVMLFETTMFSPWFFHSATSGYDGYVTIRNNTANDIILTVTLFSPAGIVLAYEVLTLAPNANTFVRASAAGAVNTSGSVQIAHLGSINAISANVTTLSPTTGLSFDAPFTPRMQWSMR
jgi:hypothetical protein